MSAHTRQRIAARVSDARVIAPHRGAPISIGLAGATSG
jgi:hypothetical protein